MTIEYLNLNNEQFETAAKKTRIKKETLEAARLVLVKGVNCAEASRQTGILRQTISSAVRRIESKASFINKGCRWVTVLLPNNVARSVEQMAIDTKPPE